MKDDDVPLAMVCALVVASGVTVGFIWLEAFVDVVASTVPPASSVGPRTPVDMSQGTGSAAFCCWCSGCSSCRELVPGPRIDWYNRTIQLISRNLGLNYVATCSPVLAGWLWRPMSREVVPWRVL